MRIKSKPLEFNHAGWGMADFDLPEQAMGDTSAIPAEKLAQLALQAETREVSAIQPAYDLDRLTLAHERSLAQEQGLASNLGLGVAAGKEKVVLYIPDSDGRYWEKRSIAQYAALANTTTVIFRLEKFSHQFPLRLDPCQCPGLIRIDCITAFDTRSNRIVWQLDGGDSKKLMVSGTAVMTNRMRLGVVGRNRWLIHRNGSSRRRPLDVLSTGLDPQLLLPPLPNDVGFPLVISVEMKLIPS